MVAARVHDPGIVNHESGNGNPSGRGLVLYESFFGNTERVAQAVAAGLRLEDWSVTVLDVSQVDDSALEGIDLLVVGAPTHAFSLSRSATRTEAVGRGGSAAYGQGGMREWLERLDRARTVRLAAAFDTRVSKVRHLPASAARRTSRILRSKDYHVLLTPHGFIVRDVEGPLEPHQTEDAIAWGRAAAREAQVALSALRVG